MVGNEGDQVDPTVGDCSLDKAEKGNDEFGLGNGIRPYDRSA